MVITMRPLMFILPVLPFFAHAQNIQGCPANAKTFTNDDGSVWEHCPYSDIQTNTVQLIPNIISAHDCLQACVKYGSTCKRAVWDSFQNYCHVKGDGGNWALSRKFDTIRFISKGTQPIPGLTACPSTPKFYEADSGAIYEICENTDYYSDGQSINWNLATQTDCVKWCASTAGCVFGIWDKNAKACHSKIGTKQWVNSGSTTFDAIRQIAPPAPLPKVTGFTTCPGATTTWTLDDGSVYEACPGADYQVGNTYNLIEEVRSDWDCVRQCNLDSTCYFSVWDTQYNYCHLKVSNGLNWVASTQFNTARLIKRGSRSNVPYTGIGRWSTPFLVPANPVGMYVVPKTERVLGYSSYYLDNFGGPTGKTQFSDWNWATGDVSLRTIANTGHDMFCPGMSTLADGRMVVSGGNDASKVSIYDPVANNFASAPDMKIARGYQTSATCSSGKVFTIGGGFTGPRGGKTGEIYDPNANTWTLLNGCDPTPALTAEGDPWRNDNHMWLYGWKSGSVFQAGPSKQQNWYNTNNNGGVTKSGIRDSTTDAMNAVHAMYDAVNGKIWSGGGSPLYSDSYATTNAHITTINQTYQAAKVQQVAPLPRSRVYGNVAILPDGQLFVNGGQSYAKGFQDTDSQMITDMYNPASNSWKAMAAAKIPRNYHSVSLLLIDGTVLTGGGGLCWLQPKDCDRNAEHPSFEIFSPPYLFNSDGTFATRPRVNSVSSTSGGTGGTAKAGDTLTVNMDTNSGTTKFSLMRLGSATHSINSDQRRVPLSGTRSNNVWSLKLPKDYGILLPGWYYLFAVNGAGVPSYGQWLRIAL